MFQDPLCRSPRLRPDFEQRSLAIDGYDAYVGGDSTDTGLPLVGNVFDSTPASNEGWVAKWSLPSSSQ